MKVNAKRLSSAIIPLLALPLTSQATGYFHDIGCNTTNTYEVMQCAAGALGLEANCVIRIPVQTGPEFANCMADVGDWYDNCFDQAYDKLQACLATC